jgi:DNA-binding NarL/FixJ family response regulator
MKILIADDHALMRTGLCNVLAEGFPSAVILQAATAAETLALAETEKPGIAIVDLFMPDMDGFFFLRKLIRRFPDLPIAVISASDNPVHIRKALDLGASGYIPKSVSEDVFLSAIAQIFSGGVYIPEDFNNSTPSWADPSVGRDVVRNTFNQLTGRQLEILHHLGLGKSNKQIARDLALSENTVKVHVSTVLRILELDNRTQASSIAQKIDSLSVTFDAEDNRPEA